MSYPENTGSIIAALYPLAQPLEDYTVERLADGSIDITAWDEAKLGSKPSAEDVSAAAPRVANAARWAVQAKARKDREASAALAEPESSDPNVLRRKLNAALHLLNTR